MADNGVVKSSTKLWSEEVKLADPECESRPETEYEFSGGRKFVRPA